MIALLGTLLRSSTMRPSACSCAWLPRPTTCERLEGRTLLSAAPVTAPGLLDGGGPALTQAVQHDASNAAKALAKSAATSVLPVQITGVGVNNGQLVALGRIGSQVFSIPLALSATPSAADPAVSILHLRIDPIHLDLLGLKVDTSAICLDIGAQPGPGNLLGNLLAGVANLLNQGTPLGGILGGLTSTQLTTLTNGLTDLLNGVFGVLTAPGAVSGVGSTGTGGNPNAQGHSQGDCDILNLSVGPVDLNLLGLTVGLDNCNDGPVTVDITAEPGSGNLLGNLLCGLSRALDRGATAAIDRLIDRIAARIGQLL